jgi:TonB family protein
VIRFALFAVAAVTAVRALPAQGTAHDSIGCYFDTTGFERATPLAIGLAPGWRGSRLTAGKPVPAYYLLVAQAIRQYYRAPRSIGLPFWARTMMIRSLDSLDTVGYGLDGTVFFRLDETGQLADSAIQVTTASPEFNASVIAAVRRADSASAFPPPEGDVKRDQGRIVLRTVNFEKPTGAAVGLARVSVPIVGLDRSARFLSQPKIAYPADALGNVPGDNITLQFVVNERGTVDPASLRILQGEYREFATSALQALAGARFSPAQVSGCEVPELIEFQIRYKERVRCVVAGPC